MSSMSLPLAGLALILSVVSASAADGVASQDVSAPAVVAAQPATPAPANSGKSPRTATTEKTTATDLGAARAATARRIAAPAPRTIRRTPQHARLDCSGVWCGRQFVLMLGVAY